MTAGSTGSTADGTHPHGLRCAHLENPLAVAPDRVRFSWVPASAQRAFRVIVTSPAGDLHWDSGRVDSASAADVAYAGPPLAAGERYAWRVRVWDDTGSDSPWSQTAWFEVGAEDWDASWIAPMPTGEPFDPPGGPEPFDPLAASLPPAPYLRREFSVTRPVARARLRVTARGLYEARLNGQRVGDLLLQPGWTDYARRQQYQAYDVTGLLRPGANVLGALLGDGWYCGFTGFDAKRPGYHYGTAPALLAQLDITFADGTTQRVVTDDGWRATAGAIRHADLLMGERQDASLEPAGWDAPGFDASGWRGVTARPRDATPLVPDPGAPLRATGELSPRSISPRAGGYLVDFGQNLTGWVRLAADVQAGTRIRIRHGEVLDADGNLYTENLRTARQLDEYTAAGGPAMFEPHFTVHGFRYAEITGLPEPPRAGDVTAVVVGSDTPPAGSFDCDVPWVNRLHASIDWGQRGNFVSVPTDCPQRDERLGWLGDAQVFARTACYNRDAAAFFGKWLDDVADAQLPSGAFPDIAPRLWFTEPGAPGWGDAGVIVPWTLYLMYGDRGILLRHLSAMTAWMDFLERENPGCLRTRGLGANYGDWLSPHGDHTPRDLLATAYWAYDADLMARIGAAVGRPDIAGSYQSLLRRIRTAFRDAYVRPDGTIRGDTQTGYVLGLRMGLVPDAAVAAGHLVRVLERDGWHLSTGFLGVSYLLPVLCEYGRADVAYRVLERDSAPSWRHMTDNGATTIWERWDGWTAERGFQSPHMNSFNHYALGSVGEWLYRFVLGIEPAEPGFGRVLLRPHPGGSLTRVSGGYRSVRGTIETGWARDGGEFRLRVSVPPGMRASVRVPSAEPERVRDGDGSPPDRVAAYPGAVDALEAVFETGPGAREFRGPALPG
ncbi:MAG TPA: family 78 glycoside hydrolase catalytic domain [Trebonia sp.]|nr:family 78 glycoside hydrolase catalytic domain [Trebonia sp.]